MYGGGSSRPGMPNLSFLAGQTVANLIISPVGVDGMVDLYNGSTGPVQLVADIWGYYYLGGTVCRPILTPAVVLEC